MRSHVDNYTGAGVEIVGLIDAGEEEVAGAGGRGVAGESAGGGSTGGHHADERAYPAGRAVL